MCAVAAPPATFDLGVDAVKARNQKPEIQMNDQNQSSTLTSMSSVESRLRPEGKPKKDEITLHSGFGPTASFEFLVSHFRILTF